MPHFPYRVFVEYSAEDEAHVARVPAFEGVSAHGDTPEEAAHEACVAAEAVLASLRDHHRPIPEPDSAVDYSGQLRLRIPRDLHRRLSERAAAEDVSLNNLLVFLLSDRVGAPFLRKR